MKKRNIKFALNKKTIRRIDLVNTITGGGGHGNDLLQADDVLVPRPTYYQNSNCLC